MKKILPKFKTHSHVLEYLPDEEVNGKFENLPRSFFWSIIYTIDTGFCDFIIAAAQRQRDAAPKIREIPKFDMVLTKEFAQSLLQHDHVPSKVFLS